MGSDFREQLKGAAKDLGIEPAASPADSSKSLDEKRANPQAENKDIKVGDLVQYAPKSGKGFTIFRLAGGRMNNDLSIKPRMGYKDKDNGFIVESLQEGGMVEIKPVRYSYKSDEGQTYLVSKEDIATVEGRKFSI